MAYRTVKERYRREPNLRYKDVKTVLPLHFQEEYPNLVSFLETYYDTDPTVAEDFFELRDLDNTTLESLDRLFYEIGNGARPADFADPRFVGKLIHIIIQNKGNEYSAQLFFRLFYGEIPTILYPKDNLFIVAESPLNNTSYVIQDGAKFQFLSVLIRTGIPISEWEPVYRQFVHTAGYYLSAEVLIEGVASLELGTATAIPDSDAGTFLIAAETGAPITLGSVGEMDILLDSSSDTESITYVTTSISQTIEDFKDIEISVLDAQYENINDMIKSRSPRFSEDSDGTFKSPYFSSSIETWDNNYRDSSYESRELFETHTLLDGVWNDEYVWHDVHYWEDSEGSVE